MSEMQSVFPLDDHEVCPCGSNMLFSTCCKGKKDSVRMDTKKPIQVQIMEMMRRSMEKCCMHPDRQSCKGRIKEAHALQNNKIISLLAGQERHVYMLNPKKQPIIIQLENGEFDSIIEVDHVSANDATTETCFCDLHDNTAFAIIEKGAPAFNCDDEAMKFTYAYKAFIFEYYKQWMALKIFRQNFSKYPQTFQQPEMVAMYRMLQMKMSEFEPVKAHFDHEILAGTCDGIETCIVKIPEQIKFANYAYIAPDFDLNGNQIKHTIDGMMYRLAITVIPEESESYILLSCLKQEPQVYCDLFQQLMNSSLDKIKYFFSMILPLYSENMVLSPTLWNKWNEEIRMAYTFLANAKGPSAVGLSMAIGMGFSNAALDEKFDYSQRGKIDLFV